MSFVSLDVNAGSWQDPKKLPGMANLLEHMEFGSSKSYPEINYFDEFLANNGGNNKKMTIFFD